MNVPQLEKQDLDWNELDERAVDAIRVLAADAVEKVGNGHPGTAMSLAPAAYLLFQKFMRHDPTDPEWTGRDRFVLSPGHTSLTLYIQLFLSGYGLELDDLKALRTWGSKTPGHPEYRHTAGVEITTGPLGQGLASSVGFAYAQRRMRGLLDPEAPQGESPFDHTIWVIASDGDLQEGVTSEASSLAGHQELGNLVVIYDENHISIEDDTDISFTEDVLGRYAAYGWHTQRVDWTKTGEYVEDVAELYSALVAAKAETSRPSIISLRTIIGWPAPNKQNTGKIHGSALGKDEVAALKTTLGLDPEQNFQIDDEVLTHARKVVDRGQEARKSWEDTFSAWKAANPDSAALLERISARELPEGWESSLPEFEAGKDVSTRAASGKVLSAIGPVLPELWGGSADLAESNNTTIEGSPSFIPASKQTDAWSGNPYGRVLHFGIREHAAAAIVNGIVMHSSTRAFSGTFLIFSDYQRPAIRLGALMGVPAIYVWTHDSIGLGEDGPTHQPVEQLASLRAIPGLDVVRPGDANEVAVAWRTILENTSNPAGIVLTRQNIPTWERGDGEANEDTFASAEGVAKGAYVLAEAPNGDPDVILIATGSEVQLAVEARSELQKDGIAARVVSLPCLEWFNKQDESYRESVLPSGIRARVSVEAGIAQGWRDLVGDAGRSVSTMMEATITTRGLIGMEIDVVNATSGRGVLSHLFKEYGPYAGEVLTRITGTLIATEAGETTTYALLMVQERGKLFVGPGEQVYEGMIVGENPRNEDIACNAVREKKLTNFRSQGEGVAAGLTPATKLSLERAIEYIAADEFVEVTPKNLRLRKRILNNGERQKVAKSQKRSGE